MISLAQRHKKSLKHSQFCENNAPYNVWPIKLNVLFSTDNFKKNCFPKILSITRLLFISLHSIIKNNSNTLQIRKKLHIFKISRPYWRCCILMKCLNKLYVPNFPIIGHNLIHNSSCRYNVHKYIIFSITWPLKPFLMENHNLIKMLFSMINKFKNHTKNSKIWAPNLMLSA